MYANKILGSDPAQWTTGLLGKIAAASGSTLLTGLVAYWPLDEVSGTRVDAVGDNDLTDNNTVGVSLAGPVGTVANLDAADGQYLRTDAADDTLDGTGDITVALWQKYASGSTIAFQSTTTAGGNTRGFSISVGASTYATFNDSTSGNSEPEILSTPVGWNFIVAKYSTSTKKGSISRNGSAFTDGAALTNGLKDAQYICVGGNETSTSAAQYGNVAVWSRILDASEVTALFNAGVGKRYADLTAAEKVGLVSFWNFDEEQGSDRADSHGSNDMSENGNAADAVGSAVNAGGAMHNAAASFVAANSEHLSSAGGIINTIVPDTSLTLSFWLNLADADFAVQFRQGTTGGTNEGFSVYYEAPSLAFSLTDGTHENRVNYAYSGNIGGFHHILFQWDKAGSTNGTVTIYVDNVINPAGAADLTYMPSITDTAFHIGSWQSGAIGTDGLIDEVAIWNRVLTEDERAELYASGAGVYYNGSDFV